MPCSVISALYHLTATLSSRCYYYSLFIDGELRLCHLPELIQLERIRLTESRAPLSTMALYLGQSTKLMSSRAR